MRILTLVALAASAAAFAPAMAQTVPDSDYRMAPPPGAPPPMRVRTGPPPGATWHGPPQQMQQMQMHQMQMRAPMPPPQGMQQRNFVLHRDGQGHGMGPGMGQGMGQRRHFEFHRIGRGGTVPRFWWGPQVQVRNWQMYGFPQPFAGGRWIRYYDDALLIGGDGRVYDERPDWDWDRYGDSWSYDDNGVPVYGDDDNDGDERGDEYGYADRYGHGDMGPGPGVRQRVYVTHGPMGPPPCANACGYGYGAGYGGYGPVLVTETTITEAPVVEQRTWVTYETVRVKARHHRRPVRCVCRRVVAPQPQMGERG
jgi:Ni/Co efflux regulator RcnB